MVVFRGENNSRQHASSMCYGSYIAIPMDNAHAKQITMPSTKDTKHATAG
jgi:hypothetical protein